MMFEKLADGITKHAKVIVLIWVIVLICSIYPALHATDSLSYESSSMGGTDSESMKGSEIMTDNFISSVSSETMQILIVTYDTGNADITEITDNLSNAVSGYGKISLAQGSFAAAGMYEMAILYDSQYDSDAISDDTGNLRKIVSDSIKASAADGLDVSGIKTYVTGTPAISYDAADTMSSDMSLVDPISIFLILLLVGLFFRSFVSSAAPPITIGVAFALVMCALFFIGQALDIYYIVEMLILVSMLGAGCDYCIFILSRYREERRNGREHIDAAKQAIIWAGESVATSGVAVMIGFGSMMICDFNMISTLGLALAVGIVFALLAALTLMSSLVVLLGDRLFWPSGSCGEKLEKGYLKKMGQAAHRYFTVSTRFSIKHAKAIIVATVLFTVPMVYVYTTADSSYDMIGSMMSGESADGMQTMNEYVDGGSIMPNYALVETDDLGTVHYLNDTLGYIQWSDTSSATLERLDDLSDYIYTLHDLDENISSVGYITTWEEIVDSMGAVGSNTFNEVYAYAYQHMTDLHVGTTSFVALKALSAVYGESTLDTLGTMTGGHFAGVVDYAMLLQTGDLGVNTVVDQDAGISDGSVIRYAKVSMATHESAMADASIDSVNLFSEKVHGFVSQNTDVFSGVYITGTAAVMVEISNEMNSQFLKIELTAVILIILLLLFVMRSYLTPIRSVVTILMSVVWTIAITHLLFTNVLGDGVIWMLPIILLVICLGLGMDYDILLTTRIREYRFAKGMSNDDAITDAVLHSGSVITICGLIMAGTFGTMMLSSTVMLREMGFALCFAILVDALIVRTYIVPAAMHLMGEWNWKGPRFLHRHDPAKGLEKDKEQ